ncbi:MAG: FapA family protein [Oscillospiraceae bacterium]
MAREEKDSLLFSLFNKSKKIEESKKEEQVQETSIPNIEEKSQVPHKPLEKPNDTQWKNIAIATNDERCNWMKLWIDTKLMQAKILRRPYVSPIDEAAEAKVIKDAEREVALAKAALDGDDVSALETDEKETQSIEENQENDEKAIPEPPAEWDIEFLHTVLANEGITTGINDAMLEKLTVEPYDVEYVVAKGTEPINGENAVLTEYFNKDLQPHFETRPDGSIDFKNMHLVTNVTKGTVICEITAPTQGTPGVNIRGEVLNPRAGTTLLLPRGENTEAEEASNISKLIACVDGNLVYRKERYCVDNVYRVNGNVDNGVGNINFMGDVIVTGDVLEGYEIHTPRSIKVFGMVEGASLYAGEQINLEKGINGMSKGILQAGKEITAKFIENCNVYSGSDITSESIINSKVECDGNIKVTGKGLITGGKVTVFGSVEAKVIGSRSSTPTTIILGITPSILRERNEMDAQYKDVNNQYFEIKKNISYLEQQNEPDYSGKRQKMLSGLNGKLTLVTLKKQRLEKRRNEIAEEIRNVGTCTLTCQETFPPARISIGNSTLIIKETYTNCRFYRNSDGDISVGMK